MNVFRAVIFACVIGMVHGQTYIFTDVNISNIVISCFEHTIPRTWKYNIAPCKNVSNWDVSRVTNMNDLFGTSDPNTFDEDISAWDVSAVTSMAGMFFQSAFNQPLNNWNVSKVTDMKYMFLQASAFNQPLDEWDVSRVTDMRYMFFHASAFNQTLSCWNFSTVSPQVDEMLTGTPAASLTHYIITAGFNPTNTGATLDDKNSTNSDCGCDVGTYVTNNTVYPPECGNCAAGKYSNERNLAACTDCPSGFYQSEAGQSSCVACAADTQAFAGSPQCYTASEMFTHTSQLPSITREMFVNAYNSRNFGTCSST